MTCLWHGQNSIQFKHVICDMKIRMKSYMKDKFKDTLDIRLFTMKTPKLSLKQKIITSVYL